MNFESKLALVRRHFIGKKVRITGGENVIPAPKLGLGTCVGIVPWGGRPINQVDVILQDGRRMGLALDEVSETKFSGKTCSLSEFVRTVELA